MCTSQSIEKEAPARQPIYLKTYYFRDFTIFLVGTFNDIYCFHFNPIINAYKHSSHLLSEFHIYDISYVNITTENIKSLLVLHFLFIKLFITVSLMSKYAILVVFNNNNNK